jgi:hypothetical protein
MPLPVCGGLANLYADHSIDDGVERMRCGWAVRQR